MSSYVTYLSNDRDVKGVLMLAYRLRKVHSKYTLNCICTSELLEHNTLHLTNNGVNIIFVNLRNILSENNIPEKMINMLIKKQFFGKFIIFILTTTSTMIYLDADLMILKNIDHLFEYDTVNENTCLMTRDVLYGDPYVIIKKHNINSGVIVFKPCKDHFNSFINFVKKYEEDVDKFDKDIYGDQCILNTFHDLNILNLEHEYNALPSLVDYFRHTGYLKNSPSIIHYIGQPKPWQALELSTKSMKTFSTITEKDYYNMWITEYLNFQSEYCSMNKLTNNQFRNINKDTKTIYS